MKQFQVIGPKFLDIVKDIIEARLNVNHVFSRLNKRFFSVLLDKEMTGDSVDRRLCRITIQKSNYLVEVYESNYLDDITNKKWKLKIRCLEELKGRKNAEVILTAAKTYF